MGGELPVVLEAPAKLTLSLRVTGVRDDGMHLIDAEMISIDLLDRLVLSEGTGMTIIQAGRGTVVDAGDDNLVARALAIVGRRAHVELDKAIPAGGGLGGGSSDAAAILRWAGLADPLVAVGLGADVAFCVVGGRARVTGIGEHVEPLGFEPMVLTLLTPPFGCATNRVYAAWDELGGPRAEGPNDLEPAALVVEPRLARYRELLGDATGQTPRLAGSGSTWFVEGAYPGDDRVVVNAIPAP